MEVWKVIFLSKWVICRFHVNLPGCILSLNKSIISLPNWVTSPLMTSPQEGPLVKGIADSSGYPSFDGDLLSLHLRLWKISVDTHEVWAQKT